jgi:hypothetical protein
MSVSKDIYDPLNQYRKLQHHQVKPLFDFELNELQDLMLLNPDQIVVRLCENLNTIGARVTPHATDKSVAVAAGIASDQGTLVLIPAVTVISAYPTLNAGTINSLVYVEWFDDVIDGTEDPDIRDATYGADSALRIKRNVQVKVAENTLVLPTPVGKHTFLLATVTKNLSSSHVMTAADITNEKSGITPAELVGEGPVRTLHLVSAASDDGNPAFLLEVPSARAGSEVFEIRRNSVNLVEVDADGLLKNGGVQVSLVTHNHDTRYLRKDQADSTPYALSIGGVLSAGAALRTTGLNYYGVSGAQNLNLNLGNLFRVQMDGDISLTVSNVAAGSMYVLVLEQDASGSHSVTAWPTQFVWEAGTPEVPTSTGGRASVYHLYVLATDVIIAKRVAANVPLAAEAAPTGGSIFASDASECLGFGESSLYMLKAELIWSVAAGATSAYIERELNPDGSGGYVTIVSNAMTESQPYIDESLPYPTPSESYNYRLVSVNGAGSDTANNAVTIVDPC